VSTPFIPYGRQFISDDDIRSVVEVLQSDFLTQGPAVPAFETAVKAHCGGAYAVAMNSATSALHAACLALGVGPGDRVWTSPITFVASANCARYCGAEIDFVDIDPMTFNMSVAALTEKLKQAEQSGKLPKVVIPVHMCGQSCSMAEIHLLGQRYGFRIIEDASHAIGGTYQGKLIGGGQYSDITVFSFHPVKIITTAEGGMAVTNHGDLARKMELTRSHGITRDPKEMGTLPDGDWYYEQLELGYNYRMTDVLAALGTSQMRNLTNWISKRQQLADRYSQRFANIPLILPSVISDARSAWHLYVVQIDTKAAMARADLFKAMRHDGIGVNVHYMPVHLQPYYRRRGFKAGDFPAAEAYYARAISLPMFATLTERDQDRVMERMITYLG